VASLAEFSFEIRAHENAALEILASRAENLAAMTAAAHEVSSRIMVIGEAAGWANGGEIARWAADVNAATRAFRHRLDSFSFGASEDATILANAVTERGGKAGYFVFGSQLAGDHHTPQFDFDESVLSKAAGFLAAGILGLLREGCSTRDA
jgi:aminobenzoyl-glutamate utilization protein A